jgi:hypothetical protein
MTRTQPERETNCEDDYLPGEAPMSHPGCWIALAASAVLWVSVGLLLWWWFT